MVTIRNNIYSGLKGIIKYKDVIIGECCSAETFLDILCQIKKEQSEDYSMDVEVETSEGVKRTYTYHFTKNGKVIPLSYPGVYLWTDMLNQNLLYLYNFTMSHSFENKNTIQK